ncbi:MAG TPA: S4 domain-containing protein [Devosiaceae bacterium]|nr:S4 domain-containing protein [Devosiaceae bacterium]
MNAAAQRLDKWLWFARCARTRGACQKLIGDGRVRLNGTRTASNAAPVRTGDVLTLTLRSRIRILRVAATGERRGNAAAAAELFEDLSPVLPPAARPLTAFEQAIRPPGSGRPTKRDRRVTEKMRARARNGISGSGE